MLLILFFNLCVFLVGLKSDGLKAQLDLGDHERCFRNTSQNALRHGTYFVAQSVSGLQFNGLPGAAPSAG